MLRGSELDRAILYASHMVWASDDAFRNWTRNDVFRASHKGARTSAKLREGLPSFEGFTTIEYIACRLE